MNQWRIGASKYLLPGGILLALLLGGLLGFGVFGRNQAPAQDSEADFLLASQSSQVMESTSEREASCFVDIKGAVTTPGVYQVTSEARVLDVVGLAGGLREDAATAYLNLAEKVQDQQLIYVMTKAEAEESQTPLPTTGGGTGTVKDGKEAEKVNINTADTTQLQTLSGIGAKKAEAIIAYREEHGPFATIEDLQEVSGIGEKTVEKLRASITI